MAPDLDDALDRLYGAELADFVAERRRLVSALKKDGRRAEAATLEEQRKPSLPAWTVNQLVRRKRKDVDALLAAGERLSEAQRALLGGGGRTAFNDARRDEHAALRRLREDAAWVLGKRASDATLDRVVSTLDAAAVTAEGRGQLLQGRLVADIEPRGFDAFSAVAPEPKRPAKPKKKEKVPPKDDAAERRQAQQQALAAAREQLQAARARESELAAERREAERALAQARRALEAAERAAGRAVAAHEDAAGAIAAARRELDAAKKR